MKKILFLSGAFLISACSTHDYKLNTVEDLPDELSVTPPENCPDWREPAEGNALNHTHTNYGCATVTNYGAMVSNPRDMVKGRGADADSERSRLSVHAYNIGAPSKGTDAVTNGSDSATTSGTGQ